MESASGLRQRAGAGKAETKVNEGSVADSVGEGAAEQQVPPKPAKEASPKVSIGRKGIGIQDVMSMLMTIGTTVATVYCTYYLMKEKRRQWTPKTLWSAQELSVFNGSVPKAPLLLACIGEVFDVTKGKKHYGAGESYNHFLGRDASRAFVSGNFSGDGLSDDVSKLTYDQILSLADWRNFYHTTYKPVGILVGRFYDAQGTPTGNLTKFERRIVRAREERAKRDAEDKEYTGCNSYWSKDKGGKVWCERGYPRKLFSVMHSGPGESGTRTRCVCLTEKQMEQRGDVAMFDGCDPNSSSCATSPPEK